MGIGQLYFSFSGRINRKTYWLASLALVPLALAVLGGGSYLMTGDPMSPDIMNMTPGKMAVWLPVWLVYLGIFMWLGNAIAVKRWHDRNRTLWIYLLFVVLSPAPFLLAVADQSGLLSNGRVLVGPVIAVLMVFSLYLTVELGFIKGTRGPNRFGPDPLPPEAHETGTGFWNWMFGFNGRISRSRWWLGLAIVLGVIFAGLSTAGMLMTAVLSVRFPGLIQDPAFEKKVDDPQWAISDDGTAFVMTVLGTMAAVMIPVLLAALWNMLAIAVKRLHDRGLSGWLALVLLIPLVLLAAAAAGPLAQREDEYWSGEVITGLWLLLAAVSIWGIVQLGVLPGRRGANAYGADPLEQKPASNMPG